MPPQKDARQLLRPNATSFAAFAAAVQRDPLETMSPPQIDAPQMEQTLLSLSRALGVHPERQEAPEQVLGRALLATSAIDAVRDACRSVNGSVRATRLSDLDRVLFDGPVAGNNKSVSEPMRGLLLAMGISRGGTGQAPQPMRGYLFFHNLENLWVCSNPDCKDPGCNSAVREIEHPRPTCGALHPHHRLTCSCGARILDMVICNSCGEVFLSGFMLVGFTNRFVGTWPEDSDRISPGGTKDTRTTLGASAA